MKKNEKGNWESGRSHGHTEHTDTAGGATQQQPEQANQDPTSARESRSRSRHPRICDNCIHIMGFTADPDGGPLDMAHCAIRGLLQEIDDPSTQGECDQWELHENAL